MPAKISVSDGGNPLDCQVRSQTTSFFKLVISVFASVYIFAEIRGMTIKWHTKKIILLGIKLGLGVIFFLEVLILFEDILKLCFAHAIGG